MKLAVPVWVGAAVGEIFRQIDGPRAEEIHHHEVEQIIIALRQPFGVQGHGRAAVRSGHLQAQGGKHHVPGRLADSA